MSPPRPEVPQFRLINPAPQQQQLPTFMERPQQIPNFVERAPQMPNFVERPHQMPNFMERPQQMPTFVERPQEQETDQDAPHPEIRIHLRRIAIPGAIGDIFPFLNNAQSDIQKEENEAPRQNVQIQQMPLAVALSKVGITPDDLRNIQRMAEEKFQQHIRAMVADEDGDSNSESESAQSEEDTDNGMSTQVPDQDSTEEQQKNQSSQELHEASSQQEQADNQRPQILALGRSNFGRSLNPIQLPDHMTENAEIQEAERADCEFKIKFLWPRNLTRFFFILVVHPR